MLRAASWVLSGYANRVPVLANTETTLTTSRLLLLWTVGLLLANTHLPSEEPVPSRAEHIRSGYAKFEYMVPMRDGTRLFTAVYMPYEAKESNTYPILLLRTPYGSGPYGADEYRTRLGPSVEFEKEGFIGAE